MWFQTVDRGRDARIRIQGVKFADEMLITLFGSLLAVALSSALKLAALFMSAAIAFACYFTTAAATASLVLKDMRWPPFSLLH